MCEVLIATFPSSIMMLKFKNILQQLSVGRNLGMIFLLYWPYRIDELDIFFDYMNKVDATIKNLFTMEISIKKLEFSYLKLKFNKRSKQSYVDVFVKDTNSFTYILPGTCFPKTNIESISKSVVLCLRKICDSDKKFEKCSAEY